MLQCGYSYAYSEAVLNIFFAWIEIQVKYIKGECLSVNMYSEL